MIHRLGNAFCKWSNQNTGHPALALVAPAVVDELIEQFNATRHPKIRLEERKGITVLGVEIAPDPRCDAGLVVFVDGDMKFLGASVIPPSSHCADCDRPRLCDIIKPGTGPCGKNRGCR